MLLQEISIELDNNGKIIHNQKFLRITDNLRFTARIIEKVFDCNLDLNIGSKNRGNFIKSVNIRNRVTHPKSIEEFQILDNDITIVSEACNWLNDIIIGAVNGIIKKMLEIHYAKRRSDTVDSAIDRELKKFLETQNAKSKNSEGV